MEVYVKDYAYVKNHEQYAEHHPLVRSLIMNSNPQ